MLRCRLLRPFSDSFKQNFDFREFMADEGSQQRKPDFQTAVEVLKAL
jgi:hypothetical protein